MTLNTEKNVTEVAAALFVRDGRFLICQRPEGKKRGLLWEFVGGKWESGETGPEALIRECREEMGIAVTVGSLYAQVVHEYPDITVRLSVYRAFLTGEEPKMLEHNAMAWITPEEIDRYEFCPADEPILRKIRQKGINE